MRKLFKLIVFLVIICVIISAAVYLDYFYAKSNNKAPKLSLVDENKDYTLYNAVLYRVYYCKTNKNYIIASYNEDVVCPHNYKYVNDEYINEQGIKISKRDLQLLTNDGIYTSEMIENMNSNKQIENAVHVAYNYGKTKYKVISNEKNYKLVSFPEFTIEKDNYKWTYNNEEEYCLIENGNDVTYAKYEDDSCGTFEKLKMDKEWCSNYESSTLVYEDGIAKLCEE